MKSIHNFHIPVMGVAFTLDSPIKVAHFGIDSVVSIIDDDIMEKLSQFYAKKFGYAHEVISTKIEDYRAKRVTAYLDMMHKIVQTKFEAFKADMAKNKDVLEKYIQMLPNTSELKDKLYQLLTNKNEFLENVKSFLDKHLTPGSIDVNIMTKIDKENFIKNEQLPVIYNDAHASLRGFANSKVSSSLVFSAGMNPRLFSYLEEFEDFYPNENGEIQKKITLKVSDFRSAKIQSSFLAKKGIWVSEFRIESGLNCGGHVFPTEGLLMGSILEEFKQNKNNLAEDNFTILTKALAEKNRVVPLEKLPLKITYQGGIGTAEEHQFILDFYEVDSVGWGSPFLLVPEATTVDKETRDLIAKAQKEDFYISDISPLGVKFNTLKGTSNEALKQKRIEEGKQGSSCPKKLLALSKEFGPKGICSASSKYQNVKINELNEIKDMISMDEYQTRKNKITEKSCLCVGLANASYIEKDIKMKGQQQGVVICPGPNMAYFNEEISLFDMVRHIYGNSERLISKNRPNVFLNELQMYIEYLQNEVKELKDDAHPKEVKKWQSFKSSLLNGIAYYEQLFLNAPHFKSGLDDLAKWKEELFSIEILELDKTF